MKKTLRKRSTLKAEEICQEIEDWIHLKQYVDLLPSEYCYSFESDYSSETQDIESQISIQVGDQRWVGTAYGNTEFASLVESLKRLEPDPDEFSESDISSQFHSVSMMFPH